VYVSGGIDYGYGFWAVVRHPVTAATDVVGLARGRR
jgi:hypothetical protein